MLPCFCRPGAGPASGQVVYFAPRKIAPDRPLLNWPRNPPQILPWITGRGTPSKAGDKTHTTTGVDSSHPERQPAPGQRARYGGGHRGEITPQNASCGDPFHCQNRDPLRACPTPGSHNLRDCRPVGLPPQRPGFPWTHPLAPRAVLAQPNEGLPNVGLASPTGLVPVGLRP